MATTLYFVRHGQVHNPDGIYYGRLPGYALSASGRAAVYCSPLLRTRQTARIIADLTGAPLHRTRLLLEVHSPLDGISFAALAARNYDLYTGAPPGFEQPPDVLRRVQRFIARVGRRHPDRAVVAVTHGDVLGTTFLWSVGVTPTTAALRRLGELGLDGGYPEHASVLTLRLLDPMAPPIWIGYEVPAPEA